MAEDTLDLRLYEEQIAHMKVSTQIIEHLSKGIYTNPARSVKELITNSYDADAANVYVRAQPELDSLSVEDNGLGMNYKDFNRNFLFISRSDKRDEGIFSPIYRRPLIGKIGIGFVAVSQICDEMVLISSKKGENFKLEASIDFGKFRKTENKKRDFYDLSEVKLTNLPEEKEAHYTIVVLKKLTEGFRRQLLDKDITEAGIKPLKLDGIPFEQIFEKIRDKAVGYTSQFDLDKNVGRYWQILIEIANTIPVPYMDLGPIIVDKPAEWPQHTLDILKKIKSDVAALNFSVDFDGIMLRKPILFPIDPSIKKIGQDFDVFVFEKTIPFEDGTKLAFNGYIYNQKYSIYPPQFRGLIVRIKNTAIGGADPGFLDYLYSDKLFFNWTFGEVYVSEGLEDAMNINRSSFMTAHEHYEGLRNYLHNLLHSQVFVKSRERYVDRLSLQKLEKAKNKKANMIALLNECFPKTFEIDWIDKKSAAPPVLLSVAEGRVTINKSHPIFAQRKEKERELLENVLLKVYVAYHFSKGDSEKMLRYLLKTLQE